MTEHEPILDTPWSITGTSRLTVKEDRLAGLAAAAVPVHMLLSRLDNMELSETAPATTFNPSWDQGPTWNPTS
ncbi:hypothetical protein ACFQ36_05040 [Arthrobacter sp. GCM10027362]|uniref:hypothetical protein n=1 Tax=Arthrobacter sp. GCM10027362 TaxID=3273379 RepID=UPI00362C1701